MPIVLFLGVSKHLQEFCLQPRPREVGVDTPVGNQCGFIQLEGNPLLAQVVLHLPIVHLVGNGNCFLKLLDPNFEIISGFVFLARERVGMGDPLRHDPSW